MIVVDSNVLACLYVPGRCTRSAPPMREKGPPWAALLLWRREFRNNLAGCLRRNALSFAQAHALQPEAEGLMADTEHTEDSLGVQRLADDCHCPAYDCKSIALAHPFGARR